jgi:hypothetical protein
VVMSATQDFPGPRMAGTGCQAVTQPHPSTKLQQELWTTSAAATLQEERLPRSPIISSNEFVSPNKLEGIDAALTPPRGRKTFYS